MEMPNEGHFYDISPSDSYDVAQWDVNPGGAEYLFGQKVIYEFVELKGLESMKLTNMCVMEIL